MMTRSRYETLLRFGTALAAFPVALAAFHVTADPICGPDDCYGDNAWVPMLVFLGVLIGFLIAATWRLSDRMASPGLAWLGPMMILGAPAVGYLTYVALSDRLCPLHCSGDYLTMIFAALLAAAAAALSLLVVGTWAVVTIRRVRRKSSLGHRGSEMQGRNEPSAPAPPGRS